MKVGLKKLESLGYQLEKTARS